LPAPLALTIFLYALTLFFGTLNVAFLLMPLNAFLPTFLFVSFVLLIIMLFNLLHFWNALAPILLTFLPIVTFVSFLLPLNAFLAIAVTL